MFDFELNKPIPGRLVSERDVDRELDDFAAFMSGLGGSDG